MRIALVFNIIAWWMILMLVAHAQPMPSCYNTGVDSYSCPIPGGGTEKCYRSGASFTCYSYDAPPDPWRPESEDE